MLEKIDVTTENMHELTDALKKYGYCLEHFSDQLRLLTDRLGASLRDCDRYADIQNEISELVRNLRLGEDRVYDTGRNLEKRSECIEDFDFGATGGHGGFDEI